jgi:hypothetical protein
MNAITQQAASPKLPRPLRLELHMEKQALRLSKSAPLTPCKIAKRARADDFGKFLTSSRGRAWGHDYLIILTFNSLIHEEFSSHLLLSIRCQKRNNSLAHTAFCL